MSPVAVVLLGFGAVSEFTGIVLIAFPDLLPHARRLSRWLGHRTRVVVNRVRRLLGLPPLQKAVSISAAVSANAAMRASAIKQDGTRHCANQVNAGTHPVSSAGPGQATR